FIGSTVIFLIIKYKGIKVLKAIFAVAIDITSFFFAFLIVYSTPYFVLGLISENTVFTPRIDLIILILSIIFGVIFAVATVISMVYQIIPKPFPQIFALLFAVLSGTFLATFLPTLAAVLVMIGLSIYDIISVFKGPIKKIAEITEEPVEDDINGEIHVLKNNGIGITEISEMDDNTTIQVSEEVVSDELPEPTRVEKPEYEYIDYIELGLGDLAFFGMLFSFALIKLGFFPAISAFIGVIIGAVITIKLLEKAKMMPGLPISIGLGLIFAFGVWGILTLSGYTGWGWIFPEWI
ncbi:MAG: hypothetical protein ACTSSH_11795, partial [Candidatus Heimdallarchaeota archaeon]